MGGVLERTLAACRLRSGQRRRSARRPAHRALLLPMRRAHLSDDAPRAQAHSLLAGGVGVAAGCSRGSAVCTRGAGPRLSSCQQPWTGSGFKVNACRGCEGGAAPTLSSRQPFPLPDDVLLHLLRFLSLNERFERAARHLPLVCPRAPNLAQPCHRPNPGSSHLD